MESLFYNISQVLGITLIHSLWQGLLVWFVLRAVLSLVPTLSSVKKHDLAMFSLVTISSLFIYTFISQLRAHTWVYVIGGDNTAIMPQLLRPFLHPNIANTNVSSYYSYVIEAYLPYISALYFVGLIFNLLKLGLSWQRISLIKRSMIPADGLQDYADGLCKKLGINKTVWINFSRMVDVPCMIGFFSPIVLLPITLTTYLSAKEIEAILLHELSHIKRNDYLLNLLQQFIGILLFFNPFAQLINRIINQERENHCDDMVIETTAQPLIYAQALLKLEQTRHTNFQLALAATGKKHHLLTRIERIMKTNKPMGNIRHLLVGVAIMAASISSIAWLNPTIKNGKITVKKVSYPPVIKALLDDTVVKKAKPIAKTPAHKPVAAKTKSTLKISTKINIGPQYAGLNDPEMDRLTAEISKHADAIGKYYDSPEFHQQQKLIEEKTKVIQDYYNRPDVKKLQDEASKIVFEAQENSSAMNKMTDIGIKMSKYYNSAEFKRMNEELEKKYGIPHDHPYTDESKNENYQKYQAELQSKIPSEVKQQAEQLKTMGDEIGKPYKSLEFRKKMDEINALNDSIHLSNDGFKQQKIEIAHLSEQLKARQYSPEMKKEQAKLQEASKKLKEYMSSPAFKKRLKDYQKQLDVMLNDKENSKDINRQKGFGF